MAEKNSRIIRTIKEPILGKYVIEVDRWQYTVMKMNSKGVELGKLTTYHKNLDGALRHVARMRTINKQKQSTIKAYIDDYKSILKELKDVIHE